MDERVTVVVATRNRVEELVHTLDRLAAVPERPRVIVVDNASSDGTAARVRATHPAARVITLDGNRGAAARNVGVEAASTPYVAFADDDSWWAPGALARAADALDARPRLALVAARILVGAEERLDPICELMAASPLGSSAAGGRRILGFVACGAVVRRSAYLSVGGFEPRFGVGGEEQLLALDLATAGYELRYLEAVVAHHHPSAVRDPADRRRRVTCNDLLVAWLRRSAPAAARETAATLRRAPGDGATRAGLAEAVVHLPWALRHRRPVTADVERSLRALGR